MGVVADAPPGRVLVVGAGGLGGITTALLWERWMVGDFQRREPLPSIVALTSNPSIASAAATDGLRVGGIEPERTVHAAVVDRLPEGAAKFDWIVLAVQPPQVEEAARNVAQHLAPTTGKMVCFQNGLCEERVERVIGKGRVVGAVVAWGGSMPEPARYLRTARGGFTIGLPSGDASDRALADLARWLEPVGEVRITDNLSGARWSKLAINSAISTLGTLGGGTLGAVMKHRMARRLGLEVMSEAVAVARALGVTLEKIGGLDLEWIALTEEERLASGSPSLVAKHSLLLALGAKYRRMRSSMLAAIERGRVPAVDFLNGEVADRGEILGVPTPVNREAQRMVHDLARGRVQAGIGALQLLRARVDSVDNESDGRRIM